MLRRLVILADDFTGACDAAGAFAPLRQTQVVHGPPREWPAGVDVLAVDLDLRERSNQDAFERTAAAAIRLGRAQPGVAMFVKIDSTLRGPIRGLVDGALAGYGGELALIAPAFPQQGRFLCQGRLVVNEQEGASLIELLGAEGTALIGAEVTRSEGALEQAVEDARIRGARRVVVDSDGVESLKSVADAWRRHASWLLVGSAGLARESEEGVDANAPTPRDHTGRRMSRAPDGPLLIVAGSPAAATVSQLERLRALGPVTLVAHGAPLPRVPAGQHDVLVLRSAEAEERDTGECARALAETVFAWSDNLCPRAVVLAGGATARLVSERLGARGVDLVGELSPGVPLGRLVGGRWDGVLVVTKAGAFGPPALLLDVAQAVNAFATSNPRRTA